MKKIGFLSFGHWSNHPAYKTRTASDTLLQSIDLAVAAEEIGIIENDKRAIFGRSYAGEPDQLIRELAQDEAIQEADTLLLTIPNTLGVDYNVHVLSSILKHVAPGLGWR